REFYLYDKAMMNSDYKKVYFIPQLETKLQFCLNNISSSKPEVREKMERNLQLISNEIGRELKVVNQQRYDWMDNLTAERFDSAAFDGASSFLSALKKFYTNRFNNADKQKETKIRALTSTREDEKKFAAYREAHHNDAITELVK